MPFVNGAATAPVFAAMAAPIIDALMALPRAREVRPGAWVALCPAHQDSTPSLSWTTRADGAVLVLCRAGCDTESVVAAMGKQMVDLFAVRSSTSSSPPAATVRYDYREEAGQLLFQVERRPGKDFKQRRPDGRGGWVYNLDGVRRVLYRLPELVAAPAETVYIVEGERDADNLAHLGLLATTNPGGAGKWRTDYCQPLRGRDVVILPDNDAPGHKHAEQVARALKGAAASVRVVLIPGLPDKGDVSDYLADGGTVEELRAIVAATTTTTPQEPATRRVVVMASVKPERVSWTWTGYIPAGKVTVEEGDPGLGKSTMTLDLAARISRGAPMPDGTPGPAAAGVVILSAEDGLADTIRPRLEAAGADLDKVVALTAILDDGERMPALPLDLGEIEATVIEHDAALVIIDPLMAYLAADVNSHRDQDVRRTLAPLAALAERTGTAVLVVRHLNKGSGPALYRGGGSIGIIGAARAALLVAPDPEDETRRILAVSKSNLGALPPALAYRVEGDVATGAARIVWEGATAHTAADLLATPVDDEERSARDEAHDFLTELLERGPLPARKVKAEAAQAGVSWATLRRAATSLGIRPQKVGKPGDKEQYWSWRLPEDAHEDAEDAHPQGLSTFAKVEHLRADQGDLTAAALAIFGDDILPAPETPT